MVGFLPGGIAGEGVDFGLDFRILELRERFVLLPDRDRLLPVGGLSELPGLGSLDVDLELAFR